MLFEPKKLLSEFDVAQRLNVHIFNVFCFALDFYASHDNVLYKTKACSYGGMGTAQTFLEPAIHPAELLCPAPRTVVEYAKPQKLLTLPVKMHGLGKPMPPRLWLRTVDCVYQQDRQWPVLQVRLASQNQFPQG